MRTSDTKLLRAWPQARSEFPSVRRITDRRGKSLVLCPGADDIFFVRCPVLPILSYTPRSRPLGPLRKERLCVRYLLLPWLGPHLWT